MFDAVRLPHVPGSIRKWTASKNRKRTNRQDGLGAHIVGLSLFYKSVIMPVMTEGPDPDHDSGYGYVILLDYWILIAAMMIGAALGYGLVL
jgi:hypothetical protein